MRCKRCSQKAIWSNPPLCKRHFILAFESKVKKTIAHYKLLEKDDKLIVGVSGGKDSLTILYLLKKWDYQVTALAIDEGIAGYREHTLVDVKKFCRRYKIPYHIVSFQDIFGKTLDAALSILQEKPCTVCGAFRRYLLNKKARELGAEKLVMGHNLDDEAQAVLMNFFKNHLDALARTGVRTGIVDDALFVPRVKPLYFCLEKEVLLYAYLHGFVSQYVECPNTREAFRADVGSLLNALEISYSGSKKRIIKRHLRDLLLLKKHFVHGVPSRCKHCGEPSHGDVCKACLFAGKLLKV